MADAFFKADVPAIECRLQSCGGSETGARGHDAKHAGRARHAHLQAFVANVRGCLYNLAHMLVREKGVTAEDATPLPDLRIGLRPADSAVLDSLSLEFAGRLRELGRWFG